MNINNIQEKLDKSINIITDILENSDYNDLVKDILNKEKLPTFIFSGVGKNWYICEKEVKTFISMGLNAKSLDCTHALHGDLGMLMNNYEDKIIFFISKSGTTKEMVYLVNIIKDLINKKVINNIKLACVFLTNNDYNYLKMIYDYVLIPKNIDKEICKKEIDERGLIPSLSIHETQLILDILGVDIYENNQSLVNNYKYNHLGGNNGKLLGMEEYLKTI